MAVAFVLAAAITGALLVGAPGIGNTSANAAEGGSPLLSERLQLALGVAPERLSFADEQMIPGADLSANWGNGIAAGDSATGRIVMVSQDGASAEPGARGLDALELEYAGDLAVSRLGWDEVALRDGNFVQEDSGIASEETNQYRKSWVGYTSSGVLNGARIDIWLDARDGTVLRFLVLPGVKDSQVDLTQAIDEERAIGIAEEAVRSKALELARSHAGQEEVDPARVDVKLRRAALTLTDAAAITGGTTMLVWRVEFQGTDQFGYSAGGTVYMDANTGEILRQLIN